jgi:hypothetical protein
MQIMGITPHMHQFGRAFSLELLHPDGRSECLIRIPSWRYQWQDLYWLKTPIRVAHEAGRPGPRSVAQSIPRD